MAEPDEAAALAWLCENLARFRRAAGNRTQLEKIVENVREHRKSATWAFRQLGGPSSQPGNRTANPFGTPLSLGSLRIDPLDVSGDYRCPYNRCGRAGKPDEKGREPQCHLGPTPVPMQFDSRS